MKTKVIDFDGRIKHVFPRNAQSEDKNFDFQKLLHLEPKRPISDEIAMQDTVKQEYNAALLKSPSALKASEMVSTHRLAFPDQSFRGNKLKEIQGSMQTLLQAFTYQFGLRSAGQEALR